MTVEFFWTVPTHGDGRDADLSLRRRGDWNPERQSRFTPSLRDERPGRFTYYDYLTQVARAAEAAGFDGLFIPYDPGGEASWIVATALAREAPRLRLLPELQADFGTAVYAAKLAVSFQRFFDNRLGWKLALDGDPAIRRAVDDVVALAEQVARAQELLEVTKGAWSTTPFSYQGRYFEAADTAFFGSHTGPNLRPDHRIELGPYPKIYLEGESEPEVELSARHADVQLLGSAEPASVEAAIASHRERAAAHGRQVGYGLRLGVIVRETAAEAWRKVERLASAGHGGGGTEPAVRRVDDQLLAGLSALGFTADDGLIGEFGEIAQRLEAYVQLGVTTFILDGLPHLEEAYRVGERVLWRLGQRALVPSRSAP